MYCQDVQTWSSRFVRILSIPFHKAAHTLGSQQQGPSPFGDVSVTEAQLSTHLYFLFHPPCGDQLQRVCLPTKSSSPTGFSPATCLN